MPVPEALRANLQSFDFADFPTLTPATLRQLTDIVDVDIHEASQGWAGGGTVVLLLLLFVFLSLLLWLLWLAVVKGYGGGSGGGFSGCISVVSSVINHESSHPGEGVTAVRKAFGWLFLLRGGSKAKSVRQHVAFDRQHGHHFRHHKPAAVKPSGVPPQPSQLSGI